MRNPKQYANLIPMRQSSEEARKNGRKGGIASGISRSMGSRLRAKIAEQIKDGKGGKIEIIDSLVNVIIAKALKGDGKFMDILIDLLGERKITQDINLNEKTPRQFVFEVVKNAGKKV